MTETIRTYEPTEGAKADPFALLAAALPTGVISWRQDGKPTARDGKYFARFVAYIEANTVRERLDSVVPGEWDLVLELLPPAATAAEDTACAFKARLTVLDVVREDVGTGKDYKQASTDAFKRAAVRFGIGHELYAYEQNWVQVDGDGKYAKPLEDPQTAYTRRYGTGGAAAAKPAPAARGQATPSHAHGSDNMDAPRAASAPAASANADNPTCPKCGSKMWDNRATKRNPKAPDFKCRDRSCDGVIWPPKEGKAKQEALKLDASPLGEGPPDDADFPIYFDSSPLSEGVDDIPF